MANSSRADNGYFSGSPENQEAPGSSITIFSVLEYKRFKGLSREDFKRGMVSDYRGYTKAQESPLFAGTDSNTEIALKQATHYSTKFGIPFVALSDYKTLILLVMIEAQGLKGGPVSTHLDTYDSQPIGQICF